MRQTAGGAIIPPAPAGGNAMTPTTPTTPPSAPPPKPRRRKPGRAVVLHCVPWEMYTELLKVFAEKRGVKLTYDRGDLEIMAPSMGHEDDGYHLGLFVDILTEEFGMPIRRGGSVTIKRKRLKKGIEADRCFWIANAAKLAGVRQLDLRVHPPPDLAIEVDVTSSSLDRFGIYAKLDVTELWRLDGDELRFHQLGANKKYAEVPTSPTFAGIAPADLMGFIRQARVAADQTVASKAFRAWARQRVAAQNQPPPPPAAQ
jgi:Uma2 family endonuclease